MAALEFSNALVEFTAGQKFGPTALTTDNFMHFIHSDLFSGTESLRPYLERRLEVVRVNPDVEQPNAEESAEEAALTA